MVNVALVVRLVAKPGKEEDVAKFLAGALPLAQAETFTPAWFALRVDTSTFYIVDAFPNDARREAGYQLFQVQIGENPSDWKPMPSIGPGVREIRIRQASGAYRIIYVAAIGDVVHVLHAFQKKTQTTAGRDIDLAKARLKQIR